MSLSAETALRCLALSSVIVIVFTTTGAIPIREHRRRASQRVQHAKKALPKPAPAEKLAAGINVAYTAEEQYKSQDGQDKWANDNVFRGMTGGVFVDLGCYDGVTYSNTWYFERVLNWTGVCVEPNPEVFPRITHQAGRKSGVQLAVADKQGTLPFVAAYMRSSLNASAVDYNFLQTQGVAATSVEVEVTTPAALLASRLRDAAVIDYVSIDVEQLELAILRTWPFGRHCVRLFNIENEPPAGAPSILPQLRALLEPLGYEHVLRIGVDEVFRRRTPCPAADTGRSLHLSHGRHSAGMPRMARKLRDGAAHARGPENDSHPGRQQQGRGARRRKRMD